MSAVAERVKFRFKWEDENTAEVSAVGPFLPDEAGGHYRTLVVRLGFLEWNGNEWTFDPCDRDGERTSVQGQRPQYVEVDPDAEHRFYDERADILSQLPEGDSARDVALAELNGRVRMYRDENRDLATLGARILAREWYETGMSHTTAPMSSSRSDADPDVKARRNYGAMTEENLLDAYRQLIEGGEARRRTLDWRADIPYVQEVIKEKGYKTPFPNNPRVM